MPASSRRSRNRSKLAGSWFVGRHVRGLCVKTCTESASIATARSIAVWMPPDEETCAPISMTARYDRRPPRPDEETHSVLVRVEDARAHCERARAHGARILMEPTDFEYGERQYNAADPWAHQWTFSETLEDVDPASWGGELVEPG